MTHWLPKNDRNCKPNLTHFPTPLGGFSHFSWWPLIFHFSSVTSLLRRRHLQQVCSFSPPLLHSTRFIQCWTLCDLHVAPAIFAQLFSFLYFVNFLRDHYDITFNHLPYLSPKLSLIVQWDTIWGIKASG